MRLTAVSQTAGPETVLCGELELPFGLIGFVTDYANEVMPGEPTPASTLIELMGESTQVFAEVLERALADRARPPPRPGSVRLGDNDEPCRSGGTADAAGPPAGRSRN